MNKTRTSKDKNVLCQQGTECSCPIGTHSWKAIPTGPDSHMAVDKHGIPWVIRAARELEDKTGG